MDFVSWASRTVQSTVVSPTLRGNAGGRLTIAVQLTRGLMPLDSGGLFEKRLFISPKS